MFKTATCYLLMLSVLGCSAVTSAPCTSSKVNLWYYTYDTRVFPSDLDSNILNAHGGGIIKEQDTFYIHGQVFGENATNASFLGFSMYSSKTMKRGSWKNEGLVLPPQSSGELGPNRKGERPHIIKCPTTGEFVLFAHSATEDYQDHKIVIATSKTVNGKYDFKGSLQNRFGVPARQRDINVLVDGHETFVVADGGDIYKLSPDCHNWVSHTKHFAINGDEGVLQGPVVVKVNSMYYWIGSRKSDQGFSHFYSTAPAMSGPWTYQGSLHASSPSQGTWIQPIVGCETTSYLFWRDAWGARSAWDEHANKQATIHNLDNFNAPFEWQALEFNGTDASVRTFYFVGTLFVDYGTGLLYANAPNANSNGCATLGPMRW